MYSNSSKPRFDAGCQGINPFAFVIVSSVKTSRKVASSSLNPTDKQKTIECPTATLAGRYKAPTWGPTQWGGEGTTSHGVFASTAVSAQGV